MSISLIFQLHEMASCHLFPASERVLFTVNNQGAYCDLPDHKAIINERTGEALSIVWMNFLIVSHSSVFQIGCKVFEILFG